MTEKKQEQGSLGWLIERRGNDFLKIPSVDAVVICGWDTKYRTVMSLWRHLVDLIDGKVDASDELFPDDYQPLQITIGHKAEPLLREAYSKATGNYVEEGSYWVHKDFPTRYGSSLDGQVYIKNENFETREKGGINFDGPLECKSIMGDFKGYPIPEHICQMQYQMWVTAKPWVDYIASRTILKNEKTVDFYFESIIVFRVYKNQNFIRQMIEEVDYFVDCVRNKKEPTKLKEKASRERKMMPMKIRDLINNEDFIIQWTINPKVWDKKKEVTMNLMNLTNNNNNNNASINQQQQQTDKKQPANKKQKKDHNETVFVQ